MAITNIIPESDVVTQDTAAEALAVATRSSPLDTIRINRDSSAPIYHQIKEQILEAITSGILAEGAMLPSERELVDRLDVSRMTIRRALGELIISGQLHARPGKGTYVRAAKAEQFLGRLAGFTADMTRAGHRVSSRVLRCEVQPADGKLAERIHVSPGEPIAALERIRLLDGEPTSWDRSYLMARLCPDLTTRFDFSRESLYAVLRREYKLNLRWADQTMEATLSNWDEQRLLGISEGAPVLLSERTTYTDDDAIIEYAKSSFRGDRYRHDVKLIGEQLDEPKR